MAQYDIVVLYSSKYGAEIISELKMRYRGEYDKYSNSYFTIGKS